MYGDHDGSNLGPGPSGNPPRACGWCGDHHDAQAETLKCGYCDKPVTCETADNQNEVLCESCFTVEAEQARDERDADERDARAEDAAEAHRHDAYDRAGDR